MAGLQLIQVYFKQFQIISIFVNVLWGFKSIAVVYKTITLKFWSCHTDM